MKIKLRILLLCAVFFVGIAGIGFYFFVLPKDTHAVPDKLFGWKYPVVGFPEVGPSENIIAYSDIRDPGGVPKGLPVRLKIPIIGVDSAIEDALITPDGRMDVPAGSKNVAWFSLGPHPGRVGSAVIGGHFGITDGAPFVFYNLDKLKEGDKIYVIDDGGDTIAFVVKSISLFDRNADATTVFTSHDGLAHLNLITCEGVWNQIDGNYPDRRVVFTDAIATEDIMVPNAEAISTFYRSLSIGMRGTDVAALQTVLEEKEFLIMPRGVTKGFFGTLTRAAVKKYQISVGLPSVGIFDFSTRTKLISEFRDISVFPNAGTGSVPSSSILSKISPSIFQISIRFIDGLYGTAADGIVTSFLLISIIFVALKIIIRRTGSV